MAPASANSFVNPKWGKVIPVESVPRIMPTHMKLFPADTSGRETHHVLITGFSSNCNSCHRHEEVEQLTWTRWACQDWGFFQIVNHGIPHSLIDEIKGVAKEFFNLPLQEKQKYAPQEGDVQGYGKTFVIAEDQTLDWGDLLALALTPHSLKNLTLWPTVPRNFRDSVERYAIAVERVAQELLSLFAENLNLEATHYFKEKFGSEPMNLMRMNLYPPCPTPELVLGLSPHSDGGGLTLLLQDDETVGLHVRKDNQWIPVQPIPYGLVVNIGDLLEVMTNGRYKSVEHRAVTNAERARLSIALFYNAGMDAEVAPASKLVDEQHPCLYRKFKHEEYIRYYLKRQLKGKHPLADFAKLDISNT